MFAPKASRRPSTVKSSGERRVASGEKTKSGAKSPSEFHALGGVLGIKCVGIFNEQVRVEQFVRVFVLVGCGRGADRGV